MMWIRCFFVCFFAWSAGVWPAFAADEKLLKQLTDEPKIAAATLSSYGHYVAALVRDESDGGSRIAVWRSFNPMETADFLPYRRPDINWLSWVGEGRLLLSLKEYGLVIYDAHIGRLRPLIENGGPRPLEHSGLENSAFRVATAPAPPR